MKGIIEQLESLKEHCQSMVDENDPECIWASDCDALAATIEILRDVEFWKKNRRGLGMWIKIRRIFTRFGHYDREHG